MTTTTSSLLSKVLFGIGIAVVLLVAAISSIFIPMIATTQAQQQQGGSLPSGTTNMTTSNQTTQSQGGGGNASSSSSSSSSTAIATTTITMPQGAQKGPLYYIPENAQVAPGSTVIWNNKDSVPHTATARDGSFDTGIIAPGSSGSATIQGQGQIQYYCTIHPWMIATLTIGGGGGTNQTSSAAAFQLRTQATTLQILPKSNATDLGTESKHKDDWITANHDVYSTRSSQQTTIGKNNINKLQVKWILNVGFPIENPPVIVGDRGYAQDNAMRVIAFDMNTGLTLWKFDPGVSSLQGQTQPRAVYSHGITYAQGVIFAPTGANSTIVALNATTGKLIWQSPSIGDPRLGYREPAPPIVWKDYVIAGSALGDEPPFSPAAKGSITAFNRTNGEKIWNMSTVTGQWIEGPNAKTNGGGAVWSGGSLDTEKGIIYIPIGNAAPDFNATSRPPPNLYTSSILAVDIRNGHILWHKQSVSFDAHDWDTAWGTSLSKVKLDNGTIVKVVLAQNKRGEAFALNADNGMLLWNKTLGVQFRTFAFPALNGSGKVWPGTQYGVEDYNANDNQTAYFAVSNMGFNFFAQGTSGHVDPVFDAIKNGLGNGTIVAVDIKTGNIKWVHPTEFPTWVSPLVTNGIVFSGHVTDTGKPYKFNDFGAPTVTPKIPSGIIMALDRDTGKTLWEFNTGAPIGIGGPSIGHGTLLVTTGSPAEIAANTGGYIVAFGLPGGNNATTISINQSAGGNLTNSTSSSSSSNNNTLTNTTSAASATGGNSSSTTGSSPSSTPPAQIQQPQNNNSSTNSTKKSSAVNGTNT